MALYVRISSFAADRKGTQMLLRVRAVSRARSDRDAPRRYAGIAGTHATRAWIRKAYVPAGNITLRSPLRQAVNASR